MKIIGAGLAGLLAAHAWPTAEVLEVETLPRAAHKALLRFRCDAVSKLTGIEFKPVIVRKGIYFKGQFVPPSIQLSNYYAKKVTGMLIGDRSIWNLEPIERYIAPENFYEQLIEAVGHRIRWGIAFGFIEHSHHALKEAIVSTAPFPVTLRATGMTPTCFNLHRAPIKVTRLRLPQTDLYQTIYFPDPEVPIYRASITGSILIVEQMNGLLNDGDVEGVLRVFGVPSDYAFIDESEQKYGKIVPIDSDIRKKLLHRLTVEHNIYSLGRFATWRNILLDDVVNDIAMIRKMMRVGDYGRLHAAADK